MQYIEEVKDIPPKAGSKPREKAYYLPILKEFIDSNIKVAKVKLNGRVPSRVYIRLKQYLANHKDIPIEVLQRNKEVYLVRT